MLDDIKHLDKLLSEGALVVAFIEKNPVDESPDRCWTGHISRRAHITVVDGVCIQHRWGLAGQKYNHQDTLDMAKLWGREVVKIRYM
tara:strand:+ start:1697 stop:1957 length:261 start_codon:yes stop_codon:yes gene_type:complete